MHCGYSTEQAANASARYCSKAFGKYYSIFEYKGRWYLTDCYSQT